MTTGTVLGLLFALAAGCQPGGDRTPPRAAGSLPLRIIIDSDANNELDDQHAIAYALLNPAVFRIEGITVNRTASGGTIEDHAREAERVVQLCGREGEVPVLRGASGSFVEIADSAGGSGFDGEEAVRFIIARAEETDGGPLVLLPIGKLTNIALALHRAPHIASSVRVVWLGSNYPAPGEYNQDNDESALRYILDTDAPFEIAVVRYGEASGTDAVRVTPALIEQRMAGRGPEAATPVTGRNGGEFSRFGDYSVDLFGHVELYGSPPARALYDMAAVAVVKDPRWARPTVIPAPQLVGHSWVERPDNGRTITLWEQFDRDLILDDFFGTMDRSTEARKPGR